MTNRFNSSSLNLKLRIMFNVMYSGNELWTSFQTQISVIEKPEHIYTFRYMPSFNEFTLVRIYNTMKNT